MWAGAAGGRGKEGVATVGPDGCARRERPGGGCVRVDDCCGMGVDEGMMIVGNEMARVMALVQNRSIVSDLDKGGLSQ